MADNNSGAAVFVKVDDYKQIRGLVDILKNKFKEARATLDKVESLRAKESEELNQWKSTINELESRIRTIDENLLEPEGLR